MSARTVITCDICHEDITTSPGYENVNEVIICQITMPATNTTHRKDLCSNCATGKLLPLFGIELVKPLASVK